MKARTTMIVLSVFVALAMILIMMLVNLRGVKESGRAFALPTYFFIVMMFVRPGGILAKRE